MTMRSRSAPRHPDCRSFLAIAGLGWTVTMIWVVLIAVLSPLPKELDAASSAIVRQVRAPKSVATVTAVVDLSAPATLSRSGESAKGSVAAPPTLQTSVPAPSFMSDAGGLSALAGCMAKMAMDPKASTVGPLRQSMTHGVLHRPGPLVVTGRMPSQLA